MALTLEELKDRLKQVDVISLLEALNIDSDDLVERFEDIIEANYDQLGPDFDEEEEE